ncbi:hypothetical protein MKX03_019704 [Papaver bracteatum]|nr:hypothetical protein MKX03_019704 [Papaver bracteatum]
MKTDPNLDLLFSAEELPVAIDNLNKFVPYFIDDLCGDCSESLSNRINLLDLGAVGSAEKAESNEDEKMYKRFMNVKRKKDFVCMEKVDGEIVNILKGVELHTNVFDSKEQSNIVDLVHELEKIELEKKRSYLPPRNNGSGKGRVALQFGCCYDNQEEGKPGEILCNVSADRMPEPLLRMIGRLVSWHVLPASCVPDSCIVQIYHKGDLILPHKDNSDFERPFCTVSLLSECNIGFGSSIKTYNERGKFSGPIAITLPVGSVLVLQGNGADVAQHCVPSVAEERISITFRKMKLDKRPRDFVD